MNLSNAHEKLGLRDYNDPEARRRANEESDLELKMTLTQGLFVASTFDFFALFLSTTRVSRDDVEILPKRRS